MLWRWESITPWPPFMSLFWHYGMQPEQVNLVYKWELCTSFHLASKQVYLYKKKKIKPTNFLCYLPVSFLVLWSKQAFFEAFFLCTFWHVQVAWFFLSRFGMYARQKENKTYPRKHGKHHCAVPWLLSFLVSLPQSLHLSGYFCVHFYIYCPGSLVAVRKRNRESLSTLSSGKQTSNFFFNSNDIYKQ